MNAKLASTVVSTCVVFLITKRDAHSVSWILAKTTFHDRQPCGKLMIKKQQLKQMSVISLFFYRSETTVKRPTLNGFPDGSRWL